MKEYAKKILSDLTEENIHLKVKDLIDEIGNTNYVNSNQSELMFILYNTLNPLKRDQGYSCTKCREKVFRWLVNYSNDKNN
jgi:hypothetical protein